MSSLKVSTTLLTPFLKTYSIASAIGATSAVTTASVAWAVSCQPYYAHSGIQEKRAYVNPQQVEEVKQVIVERRRPSAREASFEVMSLDGSSVVGKLKGKKDNTTLIEDTSGVLHAIETSNIWKIVPLGE
jgi:hypothetical protein